MTENLDLDTIKSEMQYDAALGILANIHVRNHTVPGYGITPKRVKEEKDLLVEQTQRLTVEQRFSVVGAVLELLRCFQGSGITKNLEEKIEAMMEATGLYGGERRASTRESRHQESGIYWKLAGFTRKSDSAATWQNVQTAKEGNPLS